MFKQILIAAAAVAAIGTSVAAQAYPNEGRDRQEYRQDRREFRQEIRHDRRDFRRHAYARGRYFHSGRYYHNRYRHNGGWMYR